MRPILCMVTRPVAAGTADADALVARVAAAARAGVHLIQVRQRRLEGRPLLDVVRRCVDATASSPARVLVNDRLDVALAAGAHGVHLRGDAPDAPRVRAFAPPGFLVGRSVHGVDEAIRVAAAGGLDYLILGTIFPSASKPEVAAAGTAVLAETVARVTLPVLAIGGVSVARLAEVGRAGAAGAAAIGLFDDGPLERLAQVVEAAARAFGGRPRV